MMPFFPLVRATLKANAYFTTTLSGFTDAAGRFKVFDADEAPTTATPFIHVEQELARQGQNTCWVDPWVMFHVTGKDTEKEALWDIAEAVRDIFQATELFTSVGGDAAVQYQTTGDATFGQGRNPVTGHIVVTVALQFGVVT